jgi:hypothetical protein
MELWNISRAILLDVNLGGVLFSVCENFSLIVFNPSL